MRKIILILLIFVPTTFYSQAKVVGNENNKGETVKASKICKTTLADLPLYHGVRFNMSYEDALQVYPEMKDDSHFHKSFDTEKKGLFMIEGDKISNSGFKQDVLQFSLYFLDGKVNVIHIIYAPVKWSSINNSIDDLSSVFFIDNNYWSISNNQTAEVKCKDFTIYANHHADLGDYKNSMSIHPKQTAPK